LTISFRVSIPGDRFLTLRLWSFNPLYQYCWFWRGREGSQQWFTIFEVNEERMVRREYRKPR
jgi:hypothetical protein